MARTAATERGSETIVERVERLARPEYKYPFLQQWVLSMNYYVGNQWIRWNRQQGTFDVTPQIDGVPQFTVNHILPAVENAIGKILKQDPILQVVPSTADEDGVNAADAGTKLLRYLWRRQHMERQIMEFLRWALVCGSAFLKMTWNGDIGPVVSTDGQGRPVRAGDLETVVCSPFEISVDPQARDMASAHYVVHSRQRSRQWVKDNFDKDVQGTGNALGGDLYNLRVLNFSSAGYSPFTTSADPSGEGSAGDLVMVHEYWERTSRRYPKGRLVIVAAGEVLHNGPNPYDHGDLPFTKMDYFAAPARFWGMALVEHLIGIQRAYNLKVTREQEAMAYSAYQAWLVPEGSVADDGIVVEPGSQIRYNPLLGKPEQVVPTPVSPELFTSKENDLSDLAEISAEHELVPGAVPSGARSLALVMLIEQQDETRMRPSITQFQTSMEDWGWQCLKLAGQFYRDEDHRMVNVVGEDEEWEAHEFHVADLPDEYEVSVKMSSTLPANKQQRFEAVMQMVQAGMLDPDKGAVLLGMVDATVGSDSQIDRLEAGAEHDDLWRGKDVPVYDFQNHALHIKLHNNQRKTLRYKKASPQVQSAFAQHVQAHEALMQGQPPEGAAPEGQAAGPPQPGGTQAPPPPQGSLRAGAKQAMAQMEGQLGIE